MRRWVLLCALLLAPSLSAQTTVPIAALWDVDPGETLGVSAVLERDGIELPCTGFAAPTPTTRSCQASAPMGAAVWRVRMLNTQGGAGPWSPAVSATVSVGSQPGAFTILWHSAVVWGPPSMAKTFSGLTSNLDISGGGPYLTASVAPTAGARVFVGVVVGGMGGQAATSVAISGLGGTWSRVSHVDPTAGNFNDYPMWVFECANWSGSGALTITPTGGSPFGAWWSVVEVTGASTPTVVGTPTINTVTGSATSITATMPAFSDAANQALAFFAQDSDSTGTVPGSGYTEIHDQPAFFGGGRLQSVYGAANDNTADSNTGASPGAWTVIALEITEPASGGGALVHGGATAGLLRNSRVR